MALKLVYPIVYANIIYRGLGIVFISLKPCQKFTLIMAIARFKVTFIVNTKELFMLLG